MEKMVFPLFLITIVFLLLALSALIATFIRMKKYAEIDEPRKEISRLKDLIYDDKIKLVNLQKILTEKKEDYRRTVEALAPLDEKLSFAELGIYEPHFDYLIDSEEYKKQILDVREQQKKFISDGLAVLCGKNWVVEGSETKGRLMIQRNIKLTLRAFNNEGDVAIANVRWNNANAMEQRIRTAWDKINKLNSSNAIIISEEYLNSKIKELRLSHEHRERIKLEREERAERTRLIKDEEKLQKDKEQAEKQKEYYSELLRKTEAEVRDAAGIELEAFKAQIIKLREDLAGAQLKAERAKALAEQTRTGYIYIISNIGSFGDGVVKIGLTRRLDPMDRVRELGDASVPFSFDVHAIIYSVDAPALELALHREFENSRINAQNYRKEFFRASIDAVQAAVEKLAPGAPFFRDVEAQEYRETLSRRRRVLEFGEPQQTSRSALLDASWLTEEAFDLTASGGASTATALDARAPSPPPPG